ncbi:MAG: HAD family hydrolase, partial [Hymenobacter sp.]
MINENPLYWQKTQGRVASYWGIYYRRGRRGAPVSSTTWGLVCWRLCAKPGARRRWKANPRLLLKGLFACLLVSRAVSTPLTTILFDLDDTLFDHAGTARAALATTAAGRPALQGVPVAELYQRYSELLEELHPQVMTGRISYLAARQERFQRLLAPYEPAPPAAEVSELAAQHYGHYQHQRRPVAGALALLQALKPVYKIGIVTNNRLAEQQEKLQYLGLRHLVDALITSEEVGVLKPDPRIYE